MRVRTNENEMSCAPGANRFKERNVNAFRGITNGKMLSTNSAHVNIAFCRSLNRTIFTFTFPLAQLQPKAEASLIIITNAQSRLCRKASLCSEVG